MQNRVKLTSSVTLAKGWSELKEDTFQYQRRDGAWQEMTRQRFNYGDGATVLPYNLRKKTILLISQFRYAAFSANYSNCMIEACAGLLDGDEPSVCAHKELLEEVGYQVASVTPVFTAFMSPGVNTEQIHFFIAEYQDSDRVHEGGGLLAEGEDIEVMEILFADAVDMIKSGQIVDAKTIMLIQHLKIADIF